MLTEINGSKLYYEVHGKEDGEPIFFIHGAPGIGDCRADIVSFSSLGEEYKLVFIDMRGSGRSEEKPPFTHEQWTADIDALRQYLNLNQITIMGHSYGGFLTLEYLLRYQENVKRAILVDTAANSKTVNQSVDRALESDLPIDREKVIRLFAGQASSNEEMKEVFGSILPLYSVEYDEKLAKQGLELIFYHYQTHNYAFHENQPNYDVTGRLNEIKVPVLITVGRHDWITPVASSEELNKGINGSRLAIFENSGHSPHQEENAEFVKVVREFLAQ
ncbi:alpha/beta hydrolase [Peribacillus glennii]|uniref:Alpha/beta hydrolase n=1 Tax=Peribacillus glennii TaxID=2303991 RepID=A0A372LFM6_9BACI|nr:alpha/beta hydrolase [Peribacillus glennii]